MADLPNRLIRIESSYPIGALGFSNDLSRILVIAQGNKLGVPQLVGSRPLREIDAHHDLGSYPYARFHFLGSQPLTPPPWRRLGQIGEWASRGFQPLDLGKHFAPRGGY